MADFGEILRNIGEFGLFQQVTLIAVCFPNFVESFIFASFIFIQSDPERHCKTDWILQTDSNLTTEEQLNLTLPREEDGTFSRCRMFVPVDWDIGAIREYGLNETTGCQNGWEYYNLMYDASIITDFDLVCDKANFVQVMQAVFMVGVIVGSVVFGPFADSFGRKRATQITLIILLTFTVTTALCHNVYLYLASQFMVGVGGGGYRINSVILATEWIGPSKRSWGACAATLFVAVGHCTLAGVIYAIRHWRVVQLISAAPAAVAALYIWFIPESARWLLSRGRTEEAKQLIVKAVAINKRTVPDSLLVKVFIEHRLPRLVFEYGNLRLGHLLDSVHVGFSEIPSIFLAIWLLEVLGRRILFISTLLIGSLSCILILAVPQGYSIAVTSLAVIARFFLIWAGSICIVFLQELFPTSVRQTATAFGVMAARAGGALAPLLNMLAVYHWSIPTTVFSSLILISGALGFLLPETRNKELPESADEAENYRNVTSTRTEGLNQESTKF